MHADPKEKLDKKYSIRGIRKKSSTGKKSMQNGNSWSPILVFSVRMHAYFQKRSVFFCNQCE